jgi:predicted deacylase
MKTIETIPSPILVPASPKRAGELLLASFDRLAEGSDYLLNKPLGSFESNGESYHLPRYIFLGPKGGCDAIRIGIFATIHGDEPEGLLGLYRFLVALNQNPNLARGYILFIYPICNPTGFEDATRHSRTGKDLNREFWTNSEQPEVQLLESEIVLHAFHGIINLHSDDTSDGLYGFVNGDVLSEYLLEPALQSAQRFLPRNRSSSIDGFRARRGIVYECYNGVLRSIAGLHPAPFEITFETPQQAPLPLQVEAYHAALETILTDYRRFIAYGQNI